MLAIKSGKSKSRRCGPGRYRNKKTSKCSFKKYDNGCRYAGQLKYRGKCLKSRANCPPRSRRSASNPGICISRVRK